MKKIGLILGFVLLAVCSAVIAFFAARWLSSATGTEEEVPAVVETVPTTPAATNQAPGAAPRWEDVEKNNPNGPWTRDLGMATSEDGTTFTGAKTFVERAGVPSVIRAADGRLVAAFQWFPQDDEAFDKVAVAFSEDDGETWTEPELIVVDGLPEGYQRPFDPTLALAEDGKIRLFFTSSVGKPGPNSSMEIYTGISDDGVTYEYEGQSFAVDGDRAYDSAALLFGGVWHLLTPLSPKLGAYHGTSDDGVAFDRADDIEFDGYNWTGNLVAWGDEAMRFYGGASGPGGIWWSETTDGETWSDPVTTGLNGGDPGIVELGDGSYLIIYVD